MEKTLAAAQVAETGRLLLENGLVARTWGNFSARVDEDCFCITPSGLGYEHMRPEDTVFYRISDGSYEGTRKPSSEKRIHAAAYSLFPEVGFVIHTHQTYATALGLTGPKQLQLTAEEAQCLGGLAFAAYGLPGTKKLCAHVERALRQGAHTVLMAHHGALICGKDREETVKRAELLEEICRRSCGGTETVPQKEGAEAVLKEIQRVYPTARLESSPASLAYAALHLPLRAALDDMAQMIGRRIPAAKDSAQALRLLKRKNAVFLSGVGCLVRGADEEDSAALLALTKKAAVAALHLRSLRQKALLSFPDCVLMRRVYLMKYSKQKKG